MANQREAHSRPVAQRRVRLGAVELGGEQSLICIPLLAERHADLRAEASAISELAPDVVEWRADFLSGLEPENVGAALALIRGELRCPLLMTCRAPLEGGVGRWTDAQRLAVLEAALDGGADAVDVELATPEHRRIVDRATALGRASVVSEHHFDATPARDVLLATLERMQASGASVAKVAVMPRDATDVTRLLEGCLEARGTFLQVPLVAMAMGTLGAYSRVVAPLYGVDLTFAAGVGRASAPGQLSIAELRSCRTWLGIP